MKEVLVNILKPIFYLIQYTPPCDPVPMRQDIAERQEKRGLVKIIVDNAVVEDSKPETVTVDVTTNESKAPEEIKVVVVEESKPPVVDEKPAIQEEKPVEQVIVQEQKKVDAPVEIKTEKAHNWLNASAKKPGRKSKDKAHENEKS